MLSHETVDELSSTERDLIENFRKTTPGKHEVILALLADYRRIFPIEITHLRLVTPSK